MSNSELKLYTIENYSEEVFDEWDPQMGVTSGFQNLQERIVLSQGMMQSSNFVTGSAGWQLTPTSAQLNVSTALASLDIPDTTTTNSFHVANDGDTWWGANVADGIGNAAASITKAGVAVFKSVSLTDSVVISGIASGTGTDISLLTASHDLVFSSSDADTVAWASGTITLSNGRTFSIDAGNTGNMTAVNLIYLSPSDSSTVLQTTTSASTAVGANKILIAIAEDSTDSATFEVTSGIGGITVDQDQVFVANLAAIKADIGAITAGSITLDSSGYVKGGQSGYDTGTGFFLGYDTAAYKFSIGTGGSSTNSLTWDGSNLTVNGYVSSSLGAFGGDGSDGALTVTSDTTNIDASGASVLVKQYTSISITGTGKIAVTNKHAGGTILVLKSKGNVTITSSAVAIDLTGLGGDAGAAGSGNTGGGSATAGGLGTSGNTLALADEAGQGDFGNQATNGALGGGGSGGTAYVQASYLFDTNKLPARHPVTLACGSGGGGGGGGWTTSSSSGGDGAAGGAGGGAVFIECAGTYTFTTGTISVDGTAGSDAPDEVNADEAAGGGGGGGGSVGMIIVLANTLGTDSGTYSLTPGAGGDGGSADGGAGTGQSSGGGGAGGGSYDGGGGGGGDGVFSNNGTGQSPGAANNGSGGGGGGGSTSVTTNRAGGTGGAGGSDGTGKLVALNYFA